MGFARQLAIGERGEDRLLGRWVGRVVEDVRQAKPWQRRDIDFLVDGVTVEVKTDTTDKPNFFIETRAFGKPGAVWKSRAEVWVYHFYHRDETYWLNLPRLQMFLWDHPDGFRRVVAGDAHGVIIPISVLLVAGIATEEESHAQ